MEFAFLVPHWQDLGCAPWLWAGVAEGESLCSVKGWSAAVPSGVGGEQEGAIPAWKFFLVRAWDAGGGQEGAIPA